MVDSNALAVQLIPAFGELVAQRERAAKLADSHLTALGLFHLRKRAWRPDRRELEIHGFSGVQTRRRSARASIASTATSIRSLLSHPDASSFSITYGPLLAHLEDRFQAGTLSTDKLQHLNPFSVALLLPVLKTLGARKNSPLVSACLKVAKRSLGERGVRVGPFPANGYLTYWALIGLSTWSPEDVDNVAEPSLDWSRDQLYRQLSLFAAHYDDKSDAYQLGYNILIQSRFRREDVPSGVVAEALKVLFDAQLPRGVWEKKDPLFVYGDNGDAYCFAFELLSSILVDLGADEQILRHTEHFERAMTWIERNRLIVSSRGTEVSCWRSGDRVSDLKPVPESWATAEVYHFVQQYRRLLTSRIQSQCMGELHVRGRRRQANPSAFATMYLPDVRFTKASSTRGLEELLVTKLLQPLRLEDGRYSLAEQVKRRELLRSGILFGPPGTGKTTYVRAISNYLGWPIVMLDPSDFAKSGFHLIPQVTSGIFDRLLELDDVVIFFDEMEVVIRQRKTPDNKTVGGFEEQFLTTSFLPKLQALYDRGRALFFLATNHYDDIDEAAKREDRFDFKVIVLPPSAKKKLRMAKEDLGKHVLVRYILDQLKASSAKLEMATTTEVSNLLVSLRGLKTQNDVRKEISAFAPRLEPQWNDILKSQDKNEFGSLR